MCTYLPLKAQMALLHPKYTIHIHPIVIGVLGETDIKGFRELKNSCIVNRKHALFAAQTQRAAILGSLRVLRQTLACTESVD